MSNMQEDSIMKMPSASSNHDVAKLKTTLSEIEEEAKKLALRQKELEQNLVAQDAGK